ncbi:hypothetical protein GLAREA_12874 [Glarea lozoyensis ATCC 20868]|uniref:Uncharacterized protein n=1 Tax=Glarea lozoyensis (strain ATCC 20868 / MF5171) TaxID=1116229 RepID=S3DDT4_GLAL2|nr:uncharacterized protein GLAREA_12874 [Glarea lozoyensis ATCC 20868]EPE30151.1 hypothetical protein GLAREA_12874 [Glarea lozoyensis ATCC 20868]
MADLPEPPLIPKFHLPGSAAPLGAVLNSKNHIEFREVEVEGAINILDAYDTELRRLDATPLLQVTPTPLQAYPVDAPILNPVFFAADLEAGVYDTSKPTCALNLICYRARSGGCEIRQVQVVKRDRFEDEESFEQSIRDNAKLIQSDQEFFSQLRRVYLKDMCGFWRRTFALKTLTGIGLLVYTPTTHARPLPLPAITLQEILYAYLNPSAIGSGDLWIEWVFQLRQKDRRHALEFIEGWNAFRICVAGILPLAISTLLGIIWSMATKDVQTAFTVAGFVLTGGTLILALLAVVSGIDASGRTNT